MLQSPYSRNILPAAKSPRLYIVLISKLNGNNRNCFQFFYPVPFRIKKHEKTHAAALQIFTWNWIPQHDILSSSKFHLTILIPFNFWKFQKPNFVANWQERVKVVPPRNWKFNKNNLHCHTQKQMSVFFAFGVRLTRSLKRLTVTLWVKTTNDLTSFWIHTCQEQHIPSVAKKCWNMYMNWGLYSANLWDTTRQDLSEKNVSPEMFVAPKSWISI